MKTKQLFIFSSLLMPALNLFAFVFMLQAAPAAAMDVNVTDYGAIPNDGFSDHTAFENAFNAVIAAGGGIVSVPPGEFDFSTRRAIDLEDAAVALIGSGKGVTALRCTNTNGVWWFRNSTNDNELSICDLTFVAASDDGCSGTAIQINNPSITTAEVCNLYMERIGFDVVELHTNYFNRHIYTGYLKNPVFSDVLVTARGMMDLSESGIRINYGENAWFENCYSKGNGTGWELNNMSGSLIFNRCMTVGNLTGFHITAASGESCSVEINCPHTNSRDVGIEMYGVDDVIVRNWAAYCMLGYSLPYTDLLVQNCSDVEVNGCEFHCPYRSERTMINLAGTTSDVLIRYNIFNGKTIYPDGNGSITNVYEGLQVSGVTMLDNLDPPTHQW